MKKLLGWVAACAVSLSPNLVLAQSSVSVTGTVDVSAKVVKADGQSRSFSEATDGLNSSELVFKGVEDLGDGLKASFLLSSGVNADSGSANAKFWSRRSTLSLTGRFGEVRLGRDYAPTFWTQAIYDPMGFVGIGQALNPRQMYSGTRIDNSIGYFLPAGLGGVYGQLMVAAGEGGSTLDRPGRHVGGRLGYSSGPFDISFSAARQNFAVPFNLAVAGDHQLTLNAGGSWNLGFAKILGYVDREKLPGITETFYSLGTVVPFGQGEVHAGYDRSALRRTLGPSSTVDQIKIGYVYNLSKRTAVYGTFARLDNKDATQKTLAGATGNTVPGGKSQGAEFGLRHFF
jgi:predicted porin